MYSTVINWVPRFFLVGYVEERLWWPIQSPNKGRKPTIPLFVNVNL